MQQFLDYFLTIFHSAFVLFILFGWAIPALRKAHLWALALTVGAWLILGIWYGIGYCPLTDWHWEIKSSLGEKQLPYSFVKYIIDKLTGFNTDPELIDWVTALGLLFGLVMSLVIWWRRKTGREPVKKN